MRTMSLAQAIFWLCLGIPCLLPFGNCHETKGHNHVGGEEHKMIRGEDHSENRIPNTMEHDAAGGVHAGLAVQDAEIEEVDESGSEDEEGEWYYEEVDYFYAEIPDHPITEYMLDDDKQDVWKNHNFLVKPDPRHRIVEFYAHWCPHCQHIKNEVIGFARKMRDVATHYHANIEVFAVSCVAYREICQHFSVFAYPRIFLFPANETEPIEVKHFEMHPFEMIRKIGVELDADFDDEAHEDESVAKDYGISIQGQVPNENFWIPRRKRDIYDDAYLSFHFAMKNGIFQEKGPLSNIAKEHFLEFLDILQATLPPSFKLKRLVSAIIENADEALVNEDALIKLVDEYPPQKKSWSHACARGDPSLGYTCGLWQLFHIMSIGLVEYNIMVTADDDHFYYRSGDAAHALRNYIDRFFGCEMCRTHFLAGYDNCAYDGCERLVDYVGEVEDWVEFPMWLFEFHNGVNLRLMKERAERQGRIPLPEDELAVKWPPKRECPMCWFDDGTWEPTNIYIFLRLTYWPEDAYSAQLHQKLMKSPLHTSRQEAAAHKWTQMIIYITLLLGGALLAVHTSKGDNFLPSPSPRRIHSNLLES